MTDEATEYLAPGKVAEGATDYSQLAVGNSRNSSKRLMECYPIGRCSNWCQSVADVVKDVWVKIVKYIHGREFLAEFLGTFLLTVSTVYFVISHHSALKRVKYIVILQPHIC